MKIRLNDLKSSAGYQETEKVNFKVSQYQHVFTLKKINDVKVKVMAKDYGGIVEVKLDIIAELTLVCSYSLEDVEYTLKADDVLEFSNKELGEDIFPITGNEIELDEFILSIIIAAIPLRVKKKGAKIMDIEGVKVIKENEFKSKEEAKLDSRLKALDDWEE